MQGWENIGAPIVECFADGSCIVTKPDGTGGLVSRGTVAEQLLYEVSDPQAYFVPDVTCDMADVTIEEIGPDRVRVSGAKGYPPPATLKACVTWDAGWRATAYQPIIGPAAKERAAKQAAALFARGSLMLRGRNMADWSRTEAVILGSEEEVILKLVVEHTDMLATQMFVREQFAAISAMSPGTSVAFGPNVAPMMRLIGFTVDRARAVPLLNGTPCPDPARPGFATEMITRAATPAGAATSTTQTTLENLAFARSGEKGETINVGIIARQPQHLAALRRALTQDALRNWLPDLGDFRVTVYDLPGPAALNIVMDGALPGGLNASLPARTRRNYKSGIQRLPLAFAALEVPVIAAVNGPAIGAGLDLACMCDLRVAGESAKFAESFVKLGIIPGDGGAWLIQRIVGFSKAAELTLTGETIDAAEALRIGLVNQVVPDTDLMDAARKMAARIACNPSFAVRMAKRLIWDAQSMSISQVLEMSAAMQAVAHATKDNAEAVNAFLEKRKPVFKGD